jgi:hypothetical protein
VPLLIMYCLMRAGVGPACFVASHELSDHFRLQALTDAVDPMIGTNSTFERCSTIGLKLRKRATFERFL